jgi:hypothetical protein
MIDRFPSSQKFEKNHAKAVDITLLCQLASHSISATSRRIKVREEMHEKQDYCKAHAENASKFFVTMFICLDKDTLAAIVHLAITLT